MKIENVRNVEELMDVINKCEDKVELVTREGDRLNLRSRLSQYVALVNMFSDKAMIKQMEIIAYSPKDTERIMNYLVGRTNQQPTA